jgi:hypothetical protein
MAEQQPLHVFISYVRENQEQVDRLCQELKSYGVEVRLDRKSIKPSGRWKVAMRKAIRQGDFFIACFSKEYTSTGKTRMNEELTLAIEELRQHASERKWFIPVLLSECDVPARSIGTGETLLDINWVPLYDDWDAGIQRILSVVKPIPQQVQSWLSASRSERRQIREAAAQALREIGPGAKTLALALIERLKDEEKRVRELAAQALGHIVPKTDAAVPALIEALKNHEGVPTAAAWALGEIGPEANAAVPALIDALEYTDKWIRLRAAQALGKIGPEAKAAVPTLVKILKNKKEETFVRWRAAEALEKINTPESLRALQEYYNRRPHRSKLKT